MTFSVLALLIVGLQLMLMLMLNGDQAGGPRNSDQQQGPRNRVEKMVASHRRSKNKQASLHRGKILGIVETGNDLYNTAVRLRLILFSKDIGAF